MDTETDEEVSMEIQNTNRIEIRPDPKGNATCPSPH